jgi:Flp pilus assembly protein TadG
MKRATLKRRRGERGTALIEAAITMPLILAICVGIFEFGRAYQTWQILTNAAREGARLAVIEGSTDGDVKARVKSYVLGTGFTLTDDQIAITRAIPLAGAATMTRVQINYPFNFIVLNPVMQLLSSKSTTGAGYTMQAATQMRNE